MNLEKYRIIELSENEVLHTCGGSWISFGLGFILEACVIVADAMAQNIQDNPGWWHAFAH